MNRPVTLQEILQAKITSLEEMAGQLKGLSELKGSIADDAQNSLDPEQFRQKAMEHKRDAFAALAAKYILEELVLAARTKADGGSVRCLARCEASRGYPRSNRVG